MPISYVVVWRREWESNTRCCLGISVFPAVYPRPYPRVVTMDGG
jgi:hypothetical protein